MRQIGAEYLGKGRTRFTVWAPQSGEVALRIVAPKERLLPMQQADEGYWTVEVEDGGPGTRYLFSLDNEKERPDPASHCQPEGVHGPSEVVDHGAFSWTDSNWRGLPLREMVQYELHVGTFTPEGTFDAVIPRLDDLKDLGLNTIEIMPVAQFPGSRNWGYDGVYLYAVQDSYGGPEGLRRLVDACHQKGMAVVLDVVYNHLGPEGNYLRDYGPYFTEQYRTPWGAAVNYDGPWSDEVRNFFIQNALHWFGRYHVDALRLDAIHGITDMSAYPFLKELAERIDDFSEKQRRKHLLIAESDLNDSKIIRRRELGGFGLDGQWSDDFHHALRVLLTGEKRGYYSDFGGTGHLVKCLREGFAYTGQHSVYRKRRHGSPSADLPAEQFVIFCQNHDQVGNRMLGERLSSLVSFEALKLAAAAVVLAPSVPMLFMGEEYGEEAPFLYFVSHSDPALVEAVRKGRKEEFRAFNWDGEPPDPQSEETFQRSTLRWGTRSEGRHRVLLDYYRTLLRLRREVPALSRLEREGMNADGHEDRQVITLHRRDGNTGSEVFGVYCFNKDDVTMDLELPAGSWRKVLDSADRSWEGPGATLPEQADKGFNAVLRKESAVLYIMKQDGASEPR